jgi:hypothetical protein
MPPFGSARGNRDGGFAQATGMADSAQAGPFCVSQAPELFRKAYKQEQQNFIFQMVTEAIRRTGEYKTKMIDRGTGWD